MNKPLDGRQKLYLKQSARIVDLKDDIAFFSFFGGHHYIKSAAFRKCRLGDLGRLIQEFSVEQLLAEGFAGLTLPEIQDLIEQLDHEGLLAAASKKTSETHGGPGLNRGWLKFFEKFGPSIQEGGSGDWLTSMSRLLNEKSIGIVSFGVTTPSLLMSLKSMNISKVSIFDRQTVSKSDFDLYPEYFSKLDELRSNALNRSSKLSGFSFYETWSPSDLLQCSLLVAVGSWSDRQQFLEVNRFCIKNDLSCLYIIEDYFGGWVGPLIGHKQSPCFHCLVKRREANLFYIDRNYLVEKVMAESREFSCSGISTFAEMLAHSASLEIVKILTRIMTPKTEHGVYEFDFLNNRQNYHNVLPLPSCEVCGPLFCEPAMDFGNGLDGQI